MSAQPKHRDKIIRAAAVLLRRQGYAATGMNDIVELSGAPKGSVYHYFPQGKEQIAVEALEYAAGRVRETLLKVAQECTHPSDMVKDYGSKLSGWLAESGYRDGCPITTTLLEMSAASPAIAEAGQRAFESWREVYRTKLAESGVPAARARALASVIVSMFQGALAVAMVERSDQPIADAVSTLARLLDEAQDA